MSRSRERRCGPRPAFSPERAAGGLRRIHVPVHESTTMHSGVEADPAAGHRTQRAVGVDGDRDTRCGAGTRCQGARAGPVSKTVAAPAAMRRRVSLRRCVRPRDGDGGWTTAVRSSGDTCGSRSESWIRSGRGGPTAVRPPRSPLSGRPPRKGRRSIGISLGRSSEWSRRCSRSSGPRPWNRGPPAPAPPRPVSVASVDSVRRPARFRQPGPGPRSRWACTELMGWAAPARSIALPATAGARAAQPQG